MDAPVTDNTAAGRWEVTVDGQVAGYLTYELQPATVTLTHTVVDPAYEGQGLASRLARAALDDARDRHLAVLPVCSYVRSWIGKHPEAVDLVPVEARAQFGL